MRGVAIAAVLALAVGCGDATLSSGSCGPRVTFEGEEYGKYLPLPSRVAAGEPLTGVEIPPCRDSTGNDDEATPVPNANRIRGVAEAIAIFVDGDSYVPYGFVPQIGLHPLAKLVTNPQADPVPLHKGCPHRGRLTGKLGGDPGPDSHARVIAKSQETLTLVFSTESRVHGTRTVAGQPRLYAGDRVSVVGWRCSDGPGFLVDRLEFASQQ